MREKYESLALADLKEIAKARGMKRISGLKKAELIELMLNEDEKDKAEGRDVEPKPVLRGMREPSFAVQTNNSGDRADRTPTVQNVLQGSRKRILRMQNVLQGNKNTIRIIQNVLQGSRSRLLTARSGL